MLGLVDAKQLSDYTQKGINLDKPNQNQGLRGQPAAVQFSEQPQLVIGTVVRASASAYDVEVSLHTTNQTVRCTVSQATYGNNSIGVSSCSLPPTGTSVIVFLPTTNSNSGVILGVYPDANRGVLDTNKQQASNHMHDVESGPLEPVHLAMHIDKDYVNTVDAGAGRPIDHMPGNESWVNEQGVGISILNLLLLLKATDRARLEFGLLDDFVRLISGYFQHLSAQGTEQIYNDGGFLTRELGVSIYQWEHSGFLELGQAAFTDAGGKNLMKTGKKSRYDFADGEVPVPRKRMQCFTGYLGDILNMFVANPDPDVDVDAAALSVRDQGLLHTHVDTSGRLTVRSASGISFQRSDCIPVPKRLREPWDPAGTKVENADGKVPGTKAPYKLDDNRERSMFMRDANAYRNAQAYTRLHNQSQAVDNDHPDFYLPEEHEMHVPADAYDKQGAGTEQFQKSAHKQAYFNIEEDGSIVFRDAWGSEIIMRGGSIIFSCAGQMELRTGKSIVQVAGDDVVIKAKNSIDITASDKDLRLKAHSNLHMLAEGSDSRWGGGILLESTGGIIREYKSSGEAVRSGGIVFKSETGIAACAPHVVLSASNVLTLDGKDSEGNLVGGLDISVHYLDCISARRTAITTGEDDGNLSALYMSPEQAILGAETVYLGANKQLGLAEGKQEWIPLDKAAMKKNFYTESLLPKLHHLTAYLTASYLPEAFPPSIRPSIHFTYRSTNEYGTSQAVEVDPEYAKSGFAVYQPAWANLVKEQSPFLDVELTTWKEYDIDGTYPWPGHSAYDNNTAYVKIKTEAYIEDGAQGIAKDRADIYKGAGKPGTTEKVGFNEYEIVKTT